MNVAAGERVADAEQLIATVRVRHHLLWLDLDQRAEICLAAICRLSSEFDVYVVVGNRAVLDDDLIDDALHGLTGVLISQRGHQPVGVPLNLAEPMIGCESHAGAVERSKI